MPAYKRMHTPKVGDHVHSWRPPRLLISTGQKDFSKLRVMKINTPLLFTAIVLVGIGLLPNGQAVSPPPDGGYPGGNTAEGQSALLSLTTGTYNTAVGLYSLVSLTNAAFCTGVGAGTLLSNTADDNTATGAGALLSNTTGVGNTANGAFALFSNVGGSSNTAVGDRALLNNLTGGGHTAVGFQALQHNTAPGALTPGGFGSNTAVGVNALAATTSGAGNTAVGSFALVSNDTGILNTAIGASAGAIITGNSNICIGAGVNGASGENNTIRIGDNLPDTQGDSACYIGGIYNQLGDPGTLTLLGIDANGKLATGASSRRFKQDIKPIDKASEAILALKPVAFHYKGDAKNTPCFGLIAEEVAEVNPDLVVRNKNGEIWTVRYEQINAMLLNEFLKEHRKVEQLKKDFESKLAEQERRIEALTSGLEKVNAQLESSKPTPQVVVKNR
jgi:hypothetical protein